MASGGCGRPGPSGPAGGPRLVMVVVGALSFFGDLRWQSFVSQTGSALAVAN